MNPNQSSNKNIFNTLFKYGLKNLYWEPFITVKQGKHILIVRGLIDKEGKIYGDKIGRWDVVVDGVIGPDDSDLKRLGEAI